MRSSYLASFYFGFFSSSFCSQHLNEIVGALIGEGEPNYLNLRELDPQDYVFNIKINWLHNFGKSIPSSQIYNDLLQLNFGEEDLISLLKKFIESHFQTAKVTSPMETLKALDKSLLDVTAQYLLNNRYLSNCNELFDCYGGLRVLDFDPLQKSDANLPVGYSQLRYWNMLNELFLGESSKYGNEVGDILKNRLVSEEYYRPDRLNIVAENLPHIMNQINGGMDIAFATMFSGTKDLELEKLNSYKYLHRPICRWSLTFAIYSYPPLRDNVRQEYYDNIESSGNSAKLCDFFEETYRTIAPDPDQELENSILLIEKAVLMILYPDSIVGSSDFGWSLQMVLQHFLASIGDFEDPELAADIILGNLDYSEGVLGPYLLVEQEKSKQQLLNEFICGILKEIPVSLALAFGLDPTDIIWDSFDPAMTKFCLTVSDAKTFLLNFINLQR